MKLRSPDGKLMCSRTPARTLASSCEAWRAEIDDRHGATRPIDHEGVQLPKRSFFNADIETFERCRRPLNVAVRAGVSQKYR